MSSSKQKMKESSKVNLQFETPTLPKASLGLNDAVVDDLEPKSPNHNRRQKTVLYSLKKPSEMNILEKLPLQRQTNRPFDWTPPSIINYILD